MTTLLNTHKKCCFCDWKAACSFLSVQVPRDGRDIHRARRTAPWPLTLGISKVPGAGTGVWTNAELPKQLVFGPYDGHIFSEREVDKESGYAWKVGVWTNDFIKDQCWRTWGLRWFGHVEGMDGGWMGKRVMELDARGEWMSGRPKMVGSLQYSN